MRFLIYTPDGIKNRTRKGIDMWKIDRASRCKGKVLKQNQIVIDTEAGNVKVEYLTFPALEACGNVEHLFTTRVGGASEGIYSTMNLSYSRGDNPEHVLENYKRIGQILGCDVEDMVASQQTHTTNIRVVSGLDRGKGVTKELDYTDIDGLITNEKGIALACFYADCVPLYFVDKEHSAIGLAHSGWRGTVAGMGRCMVEAMEKKFGTKPEQLVVAIGPSICQECYEVSEDVANAFRELVLENADILDEINTSGIYQSNTNQTAEMIVSGKEAGKYQLDLWLANLIILRKAGVPLENISVTDVCTCHNAEYLHSHRASNGLRGNLAAFLMLKKS